MACYALIRLKRSAPGQDTQPAAGNRWRAFYWLQEMNPQERQNELLEELTESVNALTESVTRLADLAQLMSFDVEDETEN